MTSFATGPEELRILIERSGGSTTPIIAQSLASVVAVRAQECVPGMAPTVLRFIAAFNRWSPAETVMNALAAVQHVMHYVDASAGDSLRPVSAFVRKCLDYEGRHLQEKGRMKKVLTAR